MDMWTLLYLKWITKKTYYIAQGTLLNVPCQPGWKRGLGRMEIHVHVWLSLRCSSETITLLIGYTPIQNKKLQKRKGWLCRSWSPQLLQTQWMNSTNNHMSLEGELELQMNLQPLQTLWLWPVRPWAEARAKACPNSWLKETGRS